MHVGIAAIILGILTVYVSWRTRQRRKGSPQRPSDNVALGALTAVGMVCLVLFGYTLANLHH
jgi:uncharacterized iron-regulated membrane protein